MLIQIRAQYLSHNCIMNGVTDLGTATNHSQRFRLDENVNTRNSQWRAQSYNQNHMSYVAQDDYYFDNFTDTEDTNTPDVLYESSNVYHKQIQFKVNNNLSRMSSRESMEYISNTLVDNSNYRGGANAVTVMSPTMMQNAPGQIAKCRQLPCRTFISTGSCPYGDRCVFLHDACIASKPVYIKSKRKSKEDMCVDAFFWPTMPLHAVMGRVDHRNLPLITQPYVVPPPSTHALLSGSNNDVAVFSMWEHFLDFCKEDALSSVCVPRKVPLLNPYSRTNAHTGKKRLSVFVSLSQQRPHKTVAH